MEKEKTHYRKAFNSPYLSSADIIEPTVLTISRVALEKDHTKRTKDSFNTAYFTDKEIRQGEILKPMILNAHNSRVMKSLTGSSFLDDWNNIQVTIYVDTNVRFGASTVEGLRISTEKPRIRKEELIPDHPKWPKAVESYKANKNFNLIEKSMIISDENKELIKKEAE